jgi:hypothetical protein
MTAQMDKASPPPEKPKTRTMKPRPPSARIGGARQLADLMPAISETAFRKFGFVQSALLTRWPEIVGDRLARVTQPESLRFARGTKAEGTLRLTVSSAASTMVSHLTPDLMASVNRFFGYRAVAKVTLLHGNVRRPVAPVATSDLPAPPPKIAELSLAPPVSVRKVADPELRAVLEGLAASLSRHGGPPKIG